VSTLEESIYNFLQQDYPGEKELVIVNDYPKQKLIFNHPEIKIINLDYTFSTIGAKENYAIELCQGELIAVWDDDDIALTNHLSNVAKFWKEDTNILHWANGVYYNIPDITELTFIGNSGMVYSKKAWEQIGKSPLVNAGGDTTLMYAIHALGEDKAVMAFPPNEEVSWFYRWSIPLCYHQSGNGFDKEGKPNIIQRHSSYIEEQRIKGFIPTGEIHLEPKWNQDYPKLLVDFNKKHDN
jgi:glycosyltransferase involved in cell wall biosynthesis